jgi:hypothetical protein
MRHLQDQEIAQSANLKVLTFPTRQAVEYIYVLSS